MNWHKPLIERGDFVVTPYELASAAVCVGFILSLCFVVLVWGD